MGDVTLSPPPQERRGADLSSTAAIPSPTGEQREAVTLLLELFMAATDALLIGFDGALKRALIYATVLLANYESGFAVGGRVPAATSRAITLRALSRSIGLEPETVRRHLLVLRAKGLCVASPSGIVITDFTPIRDAMAAVARALARQTARATGAALPPLDWTSDRPPILAVRGLGLWVRVFTDCAPAFDGDFDLLWLFATIGILNTEHLRSDPGLSSTISAIPTLPDAIKRPATIGVVAHRAGVAPETARRRIQRLIALGYCETVGHGVIALESAIRDPRIWHPLSRAPTAFSAAARDAV